MDEPNGHPPDPAAPPAPVLLAAWLLPAATLAAATVWRLTRPEGAAPDVGLRGILCLAWLGLALWPAWRALLLDVGRRVLAGVHFLALALVAALVAVLGLSSQAWAFWSGVVAGLALLTLSAGRRALARDRRGFAFALALLAVNLLLLVALDAFVGAFVLPSRSHDNIAVVHDPLLGWRLRPGLSVERQRRDGVVVHQRVDRHGFRTPDVPFAKPEGVRRVLVLGDSFTEAYTVSDGETYPELLQERLSATRPVEVISIGVAGYSTDQELLAYLEYGRRYSPDLVLLQLCTNDLEGNVSNRYWRGYKPHFARFGDFLVLEGVPVPNVRNTGLFGPQLFQHSNLVVLVESLLRQLSIGRRTEESVDTKEAWRVTGLLLRDLDRAVHADGARLVAFLANKGRQVGPRMEALLARQGIPYIETRDVYRDPYPSYFVENHWNEKGQRAIADRLAERLAPLLE